MFEDELLSRALDQGVTLTQEDIEANQLFGSLAGGGLTHEEIVLIDSYFSRNYRQGQLLDIPDECYSGWKEWKDKNLIELGFLSTKRKSQDAIYNGYNHTIMNPQKYRPRINLREDKRENKPQVKIEPEHLGFKFWLQERIEMAAAGNGSPRMLQVIEGKLDEKDTATSKWDDLSRKIQVELEKDLLNEKVLEQRTLKSDSRAPILAINIFNKVEKFEREQERKKAEKRAEKRGVFFHPQPNHRPLPIEILCREIVRSLFSNVRPKIPSDERILTNMTKPNLKAVFDALELTHEWKEDSTKRENLDWLLKWKELTRTEWPQKQIHPEGWVRLSLTSQSFMLTLSNKLSDLIIKKWIPSLVNLSDSQIKEMNLNKSHFKELKHLQKEQYFGRRGEPTNPKTAKQREDKTSYNVRRLARSIVFELVTKGIVEQKPMKFEDWIVHNDDKEKDSKKFGSYSSLLKFSKKLIDWTGKSDFLSFKKNREHAIYRWFAGGGDRFMYAPPQDHDLTPSGKPDAGGYLTKDRQKLIGKNHKDYERFNHPRCKISNFTIEAINKLQKVQWEVNLDLLLTMFRLELGDEPRPNITEYFEIDKRITRIECRHWAEEAFYSSIDLEKNRERNISLMWTRKIINHNANVFWHAWSCDWRGRLYSCGSSLSPQGDDFDKAIIRFKRWKPLGEDGRHWLFVHVHNMVAGLEFGGWKIDPPLKGQSFKERSDWVERNKEILVQIADEPEKHRELLELDQHSGSKSITFQRLAALIELKRVISKIDDGDNWDSVTSGLPIYLDASCNGYQHVSTLLRNRELAEHVNVVKKPSPNDEERGDLYQAISDKAKELCVPGNNLYDELFRLTKSNRDTKKLIDSICSRTIAKQPTMTRMYGKIDTKNSFSGREGKGKPGFFSYVKINDNEYQCAKCDFTRARSHWVEKHATKEGHWASKWHQESPLHKALLGPKSDKKFHAFFPDRNHNEITKLVDELFREADKEVTKNTYNDYKESSRAVAKFGVVRRKVKSIKSAKKKKREPNKGHYMFNGTEYPPTKVIPLPEYKYVVRWKLPDNFEVIHYYIKHVEPSLGHAGNPTHAGSIYRHLLPEWYNPDSSNRKESILKRLDELGVKGLDSFRKMHKFAEGEKGKTGIIEFLTEKLKQKEIQKKNEIKEVLRILRIPSIHLPRYESDEKGRLWVAKQRRAIPPNLIHSLDAYHMRWTINQMPEKSDLWVVHDAFGTHARDMPRLRKNITQGFYNLHNQRDINYWLKSMITEDMYKEIYRQNPDPNNGKLHVYEEQLRGHLNDNQVDLDAIPSTRKGGGKPTKKDLVAKLIEEGIRPPQKWAAEIDPDKMDQSLVDDIKESVFLVD